ncbi:hypothetical protein RE476_03565 [Methanolobus mangrovi]|uniref:Uncharacterized protein n=1 Tax=Methanolobus mangrovi TaxID=3072977 RepID=A0AA51UH70_9EURY|nr:hypothetical protein [Methanolobus mangrovi]WMW22913.1 hypothetical protein RE476_03565 [Methanolobus mangrovi]
MLLSNYINIVYDKLTFLDSILSLIKETIISYNLKFIDEMPHLLTIFNTALPLIIALLTSFGIYVYYNKNKYALSYKLEKPHEIDASPKSVNNVIENWVSFSKLLKYTCGFSFLLWVFWSILLIFVYLIFGYVGVKVGIAIILSLHIFVISKLYSVMYKIQIEEGRNNYGYISIYTLFVSITRLLIYVFLNLYNVHKKSFFSTVSSILDKLSIEGNVRYIFYAVSLVFRLLILPIVLIRVLVRSFVFILIYLAIPASLILNSLEFFILYESLLLVYFVVKCMPLYQNVRTMSRDPLFVNIEMINGETISHLLLYQTTLSDYRFKSYITQKEFIVPHCNIKKICEDYGFELRQLDNLIEQKHFLISDFNNLKYQQDTIKMLIRVFQNQYMHRVWYKKAILYKRMNEPDQMKLSLEEAIKSTKSAYVFPTKSRKVYLQFISFLKKDKEFYDERDNKWFIDLLDDTNNNVSTS